MLDPRHGRVDLTRVVVTYPRQARWPQWRHVSMSSLAPRIDEAISSGEPESGVDGGKGCWQQQSSHWGFEGLETKRDETCLR